jgi:hypothetical protein
MVANKLYINKGNMHFEDITVKAGVATETGLSSGVSMIDINNDGYLDIYICKSASSVNKDRKHILYINNKNETFTDKAAEYGLADESYSTQAYFYDMDKDGDLDMYMVNHPKNMGDAKTVHLTQDSKGELVPDRIADRDFVSNRYYENINGKFVDKTMKAGLDTYAFGLSAIIDDFNDDNYPDIYVCNDYIEPDCLYINNKNGTYTNQFNKFFKHCSSSSMGSDYADINNDGLPDLITLDMLAEDIPRQKRLKGPSNYDNHFKNIKYGLEYQYVKNCLHLNNGNGSFSDISYFAGVAFTDWSWAPLIADFDNDGLKDIYITNGYLRDVTDMDYVKFTADSVRKKLNNVKSPEETAKLFQAIPTVKLSNYMFKNNGNLTFTNTTIQSGAAKPTWSNGAAYADLDNDGDLDIVANNFFEPASIIQNNTVQASTPNTANYVRFKLEGTVQNKQAIGAIVQLTTPDDIVQTQHYMPNKGYISSHENQVHFGIGKNTTATATIIWPGKLKQSTVTCNANTLISIKQQDALLTYEKPAKSVTLYKDITQSTLVKYIPKENEYIDFKLEPLLPRQFSKLGPALAVGDMNKDGVDDFFIGGAKDQEATLYLQSSNGTFKAQSQACFAQDKKYEDVAAILEDIDNDGDKDLLVTTGGNEYPGKPEMYPLRLYINDGKGQFTKSGNIPLNINTSASCITANDYDKDGDIDLFIGGRTVPGRYGLIPQSFLLQNNKGAFTDITNSCPSISSVGMVTSAIWVDVDNDSFNELVIVGEWMPVTIYKK